MPISFHANKPPSPRIVPIGNFIYRLLAYATSKPFWLVSVAKATLNPSVCLSISHKNPLASQYQVYLPLAIMPICHHAHQPSDFKTACQEFLHYSQLLSLSLC